MTEGITIHIDREVDAAYVRLASAAVSETREVAEDVLVDLDDMGVVVGIEVLRLDAQIPYDALRTQFHVHSSAVEVLEQIRPSVAGFMSITTAPDGTSRVPRKRLTSAQAS